MDHTLLCRVPRPVLLGNLHTVTLVGISFKHKSYEAVSFVPLVVDGTYEGQLD